MDLKELISQGESGILEFKESLQLKDEIGETTSAFSKSKGGAILIGVSDKKKIKGVQIGEKTTIDLAEYIKRNTDQHIFPEIKVYKVDNKSIISIKIKESNEKPVFFKSQAYKRVGDTNQRISSSEIRRLAKESVGKIYWDEQICEEIRLEDIDEEKVKRYLERREEIRMVKKPKKMKLETVLLNIRAAKEIDREIKPTNAGVLFFAKNPQRFVLQSQLRLARFVGETLTRDFLDKLDCSGALWEMIENSEAFIKKNIRFFGFRTEFNFRRIDKLEYPLKAIREAIINAMIHRDYMSSADTRVLIFNDRIEIINPGSFPKGVTPENPRHVPINPTLCQLMYGVGFTEKYGTGIYMMKEICEEYSIPTPRYEISEVETKIIFRSGGKAVIIPEIEKLGVGLNERQRKALRYAFGEGFITNKIYTEINKVSNKTASLELKDLERKRLLEIRGKGRSTKYIPKI